MKYYRYVILFFCLSGILFGQQTFPISAFQCKETTWFEGAGEDSLGLSLIHYGW
jgi:hypothetical protein